MEPTLEHWHVVVVGAGAAGLLAAVRAAERGRRTLLLEKNRKPGVKILMSGGTRCNLTHATDAQGIIEAFGRRQGQFLHSPLAALGSQQLVDLFEAEGVPTKIEAPTGKIFPASDKALDVLHALLRRLRRSGAILALEEPIEQLHRLQAGFRLDTPWRSMDAQKVIVATGGRSYPECGTTGDAYAWAAASGHTIVPPRPALVPVRTDAAWVTALRGITLPDVVVRVVKRHGESTGDALAGPKARRRGVLAERRGSLLFTHFGLSGPAVLDVSREISGDSEPASLTVECDLVPNLSEVELDAQLSSQAAAAGKRQLGGILAPWIPQRLAETLVVQAGLELDFRAANLARADRRRLAAAIKRLAIPISGTLGFKKAEVTAGGVSLDEIDSRSMESKFVPGLYFAGEVLDLDGPIGGYNFQAAFSTGWLAGESV